MILAQNDKFWKFLKLVRLMTVFLPYRKKMSEVVISTIRLKKKVFKHPEYNYMYNILILLAKNLSWNKNLLVAIFNFE